MVTTNDLLTELASLMADYDDKDKREAVFNTMNKKWPLYFEDGFTPSIIIMLMGEKNALMAYPEMKEYPSFDDNYLFEAFDNPEFKDKFLMLYGVDYAESGLRRLPSAITKKEYLTFYSVIELRNIFNNNNILLECVREAEYGEDFTRRFVEEVGYSGEKSDTLMLLDLILDGHCEGVNFEEYAKSIDPSELTATEKEDIRLVLESYDVEEEFLAKIK